VRRDRTGRAPHTDAHRGVTVDAAAVREVGRVQLQPPGDTAGGGKARGVIGLFLGLRPAGSVGEHREMAGA